MRLERRHIRIYTKPAPEDSELSEIYYTIDGVDHKKDIEKCLDFARGNPAYETIFDGYAELWEKLLVDRKVSLSVIEKKNEITTFFLNVFIRKSFYDGIINSIKTGIHTPDVSKKLFDAHLELDREGKSPILNKWEIAKANESGDLCALYFDVVDTRTLINPFDIFEATKLARYIVEDNLNGYYGLNYVMNLFNGDVLIPVMRRFNFTVIEFKRFYSKESEHYKPKKHQIFLSYIDREAAKNDGTFSTNLTLDTPENKLSSYHKEIMEFVWEGASYQVIADHYGKSVNAIAKTFSADIFPEMERLGLKLDSASDMNKISRLKDYLGYNKKEFRPFGDW